MNIVDIGTCEHVLSPGEDGYLDWKGIQGPSDTCDAYFLYWRCKTTWYHLQNGYCLWWNMSIIDMSRWMMLCGGGFYIENKPRSRWANVVIADNITMVDEVIGANMHDIRCHSHRSGDSMNQCMWLPTINFSAIWCMPSRCQSTWSHENNNHLCIGLTYLEHDHAKGKCFWPDSQKMMKPDIINLTMTLYKEGIEGPVILLWQWHNRGSENMVPPDAKVVQWQCQKKTG